MCDNFFVHCTVANFDLRWQVESEPLLRPPDSLRFRELPAAYPRQGQQWPGTRHREGPSGECRASAQKMECIYCVNSYFPQIDTVERLFRVSEEMNRKVTCSLAFAMAGHDTAGVTSSTRHTTLLRICAKATLVCAWIAVVSIGDAIEACKRQVLRRGQRQSWSVNP